MTTLPDKPAAARLLDYWKVVQADLMRDAQRLADHIAAAVADGQEVDKAWLLREDRYHALLAQVQVQVDRYAQLVGAVVTAGQAAAVTQALTVSGQQIAAGLVQAGVEVDFNRLPVSSVQDLVGRLSDGAPLADLMQTFGADARTAASEALVSGLGRGIGPRSIAPAIRRALDITPVRALTLSRTAVLDSYRGAMFRNYEANADVLDGWRWLCARSSRSCLACLLRDGTIYPLGTPMDRHVNDRCTAEPVVKGMDPSGRQTGAEWFEKQDEATQQGIMGPKAHAAWKAGDVALSDFVGTSHHPRWGTAIRVKSLKEVLVG